MRNFEPQWDRSNDPTFIEPPGPQPYKIVPPTSGNGLAKRLDLRELFAGSEERLPTVADRFWAKVDVYGESDCWIWARRLGSSGYGQAMFRVGGRRVVLAAHRFAYALAHPDQAIPNEVLVRRSCTERLCVNPAHLYLGDYQGHPLRTPAIRLNTFGELLP